MEERDKRREKESHENGRASLRTGKRIVRTGMRNGVNSTLRKRPTAKRRKDLGLAEDRGDDGSYFILPTDHSQITLPHVVGLYNRYMESWFPSCTWN